MALTRLDVLPVWKGVKILDLTKCQACHADRQNANNSRRLIIELDLKLSTNDIVINTLKQMLLCLEPALM